jgi:hypothetical protein
MSLTAFKRKSVINYGSKRSGIDPGGYWLPQGPFGHSTEALKLAIQNYGAAGFSINGGTRNVGGIGRDMKMSKSGTPFRGAYPIGWGGNKGAYPSATLVGSVNDEIQSTGAVANHGNKAHVVDPLLNARVVEVLGTQYQYVKPSVLSTYGILDRKYRWAYYGVYPNRTVQPNYTGNQTDTASQRLYIENLASKNTCNLKVNNVGTYEGYKVGSGPTLCTPGRSTAGFKYNDMARNAPYTKTLYQPVGYDQYNLKLTQKCQNPIGPQKPFPYAKAGGSSYAAAGTSITNFGNSGSCGSITNNYVIPPKWYITPTSTPNTAEPPQTTVFK